MMRFWIVAIVMAGLFTSPSHARVSDAATGFSINPPAPFVAERTTNRPQFDVGVGIRSSNGVPPSAGTSAFVCEAGFKAAPQNASLTRAEINALVDKPEWVNLAKAAFELVFSITSQRRFTLQGYRGMEFQAIPKAGPGAPNVRVLISLVETPKGRTTLFCLTQAPAYGIARQQFRAIRSSITLPE